MQQNFGVLSHFATKACCILRHAMLQNATEFLLRFATFDVFCNVSLDRGRKTANLSGLTRLLMKITISKDVDWQISAFAKAPLELLLCDDLLPTTKLLWIVLANQANFRPIDRSVLDRRIGIHRSTRLRAMAELREAGLVSGTESHLIIHDPAPILQKMDAEDQRSREIARAEIGIDPELAPAQEKRSVKAVDHFEAATQAWNSYRPANYGKIRRMSSQVLKAVDLHIKALGLESHSYNDFFSILKTGVERSDFWSKENSSKTLQSIVGVGQPQSKKYQNVHALYNDGLEYGAANATQEEDRVDELILPAEVRSLINNYEELHFLYSKMERTNPGQLETLTGRIIEAEDELRKRKLDPAKFRMKYQLRSWPTDVPEPSMPRERFWRYDDEQ
jgi:hypothetical protein